ncbi:hypothetical protein KP509_02G023000 [Ceratopteris richardii]|uniref:Uncharacterized protein n=1 Tax=Ceratopteris richardii TaxID=49495 RepID=A0A8T2VBL9_CERRI|nr:hypothetical protein KP509_02G023000 [Ceratopteris richardii]KAH7443164.1 hypothetical protein KP509_02G023000 [Ceratopteris richardii]
MEQVFKIQFGGSIHRFCVALRDNRGSGLFGYHNLEQRIRNLFQIPRSSQVTVTYVDQDGDVITIANDHDLNDACLTQKLNPLRLEVNAARSGAGVESNKNMPALTEFNVEALLKGLFPESTAQAINQVLSRYPPYLFTTVPADLLPKALDTFLGTLMAGSGDNTMKLQGEDKCTPGIAVHKYIECDHCFMCPIVGPRYKSLKNHDYDLCYDCFKKVGNATDYRKLDRPTVTSLHKSTESFKAESVEELCSIPTAIMSGSLDSLSSRPDCSPGDLKSTGEMLDAEFVMDVTILDGSKVEVSSTLTKTWRFRNCGKLPWPQDTKLVHIGGSSLGSSGIVPLNLPAGGQPCYTEVDVSVELRTPQNIGQYYANWRLMSPSGQMFGHSVWVLIEAVPVSEERYGAESEETHSIKEPIVNCNKEINISNFPLANLSGLQEGKNENIVSRKIGCESLPLLSTSEKLHRGCDGFSVVEYGENGHIEDSKSQMAAEDFELVLPLIEMESPSSGIHFKQDGIGAPTINLNEDDSLSATGWYDMVKELEELGFHDDKEMTIKKLLLKSEGSIKRAAKELAELEKQVSVKIKAA